MSDKCQEWDPAGFVRFCSHVLTSRLLVIHGSLEVLNHLLTISYFQRDPWRLYLLHFLKVPLFYIHRFNTTIGQNLIVLRSISSGNDRKIGGNYDSTLLNCVAC